MKLAELLEDLRDQVDDEIAPYLWTDAKLVRYLNEAVDEAAVRARLLVESLEPSVCRVLLQPGVQQYPLHEKIILIRRGVLESELDRPLIRTNTALLDRHRYTWRTDRGAPRFLVNDQQGAGKRLLVTPVPTQADTLHLTVVRYALESEQLTASDLNGVPVLDPSYHAKLIHWAAYRALNQRDVDLQAKADAADELALFEREFGSKPDAQSLQQLAIDPITGTEPVWF